MRINLEEVSFSYEEKNIISGMNVSFEKGKTYVLLGRSGVGKSTLLALLKGFQLPVSGKISYEQTSQRQVEIVFQDLQLFPWQTVYQAVEMPLKIRKEEKDSCQTKICQLLEELELSELSAKFPDELSGGQQQRVAMARGLITEPDFLLLDEPTSSLDQETKERAQEFILSEQRKRQNTVITVTHDIEEAAYLGETILIMGGGSVISYENPIFSFDERRESVEFYKFCILLRNILKGGH
ncbi:ABC transporter ATP-binding protein [Enterococcus sp. BWB1-3]|uniref:ATP-binding cassette domain-containing protein n=1 Tax=unclassified Enterococcus TaxID=2608891 RepID=UPI0019212808|nr:MULTISPECIES: ATP-binding cassette domain-containing protein [unclassified Enterococcus]MBL1229114.1 ABC transporter ATP-binding protein [Enterococcus sp. BWB1-3]MCB5952494.1 ATP-binding cassette domain-containing protein [Enterococcus sp. BWT-B8]